MLTKTNPDGTWSCQGVDFNELKGNMYEALCKLRDYEKSGFEPDDLNRVKKNIHIGLNIEGYIVFAIWNNFCFAENLGAEYPYALFEMSPNDFTIKCRNYFGVFEHASMTFCFACYGHEPNELNKTEYWKR